jgi:spore germination protein KB
MLYPYLNQKQEALKTGLLYLGSAVALSGIIHAVVVGALGDLFAAHEIYAFDELVSYISVGDFIERVEMLVCVAMIPAFLIKMALIYHSAGIAAANTLGLKNYRATLIPIALITIILSQVLFGTQLQLFNFLFYVWPIEAVIVELALPALILLIAVIRKKADPEASGNRSSKSAPGSAQGTPALAGGEHFANP